ncbi:MAG: TlpA disulfide reductase family protein, partial [Rhodococcus sp. (in: high G+C Gram-positive bacteria)]
MSSAARWSLAALLLVGALVYAIWPRGDEPVSDTALPGQGVPGQGAPIAEERRAADTADALAPLRERAQLAACPTSDAGGPSGGQSSGPASGPLSGIVLECIGDGSLVDVAQALAGRPALINLWAYWCGPCAEELPYLQQYSEQMDG